MNHHRLNEFVENRATHMELLTVEDESELNNLENEKIRMFQPVMNRLSSMQSKLKEKDESNFFGKEGFTKIRDHVIKLLEERRNDIKIKDIANDCGFSVSWLNQLTSGLIGNPGVNNIEILYFYLTGKAIVNLDDYSEELKPSRKRETIPWISETMMMLNDIEHRAEIFDKISKDCNVSTEWLNKFKGGLLLAPSISKLNAVNTWLKENT